MKKSKIYTTMLILIALTSLLLSGCSPQPTIVPTPSHTAITPVTDTAVPIPTQTAEATVTATPTLLPALTLKPGDFYFSLEGRPEFVFSRNVAAFFIDDYKTLLTWSEYGGTRVVRFGLYNSVAGGYPFTNNGEINETVVGNFEHILDEADAHGIYVLPFFTGWDEWGVAPFDWAKNPFNVANGGPAKKPLEVFQDGTSANRMWFAWVKRLVTRWQGRKNILAWEVMGEANLFQGVSEQQGVIFTEHMAQVVHAADPQHRPITASLADVGNWPNYYKTDAIDFVQIHPYRSDNQLDRDIIAAVHENLIRYNKPVLIGESGLNFEPMTKNWITASSNAHVGIEHAVWAGMVSGSMNGRALYWEDSYGVYFQPLRSKWLNQYSALELPAARFASHVEFTDFKPLTVKFPADSKVWGAAVGNENSVLGWFRDAGSEPPKWDLRPSIQGQTVTILVPGSAQNWQVDFYDTKTGYPLSGSSLLTRQADHVAVSLPDFTDDIAFKLYVNATGAILPLPTLAPQPGATISTSTDPIAGQWVGTVFAQTSDWAAVLHLTIQAGCKVGAVCGKASFDWCSIGLNLKEIDADTLVFGEPKVSYAPNCAAGGSDRLHLQPDGTLLLKYTAGTSGGPNYVGILHRP